MTIDIHSLLEKNPVTKYMVQPKFGYKYLGAYNRLDKQLLYNRNTGNIFTYYDKPKNGLDKIASRHDTCYAIKKIKTIVIELWLKKLTIYLIKINLGVLLQ